MGRESRTHRQALALVDLLKTLPDEQLREVLDGLGIATAEQEAAQERRRTSWRYCGTCGLVYPRCRAAYAGDHDFIDSRRHGSDDNAGDGSEALKEALEPSRSTT